MAGPEGMARAWGRARAEGKASHTKSALKAGSVGRLDGVAGVGEKRKKAILKHFSTVEALKNASVEEIAAVPGMTRPAAENVYAMLHMQE